MAARNESIDADDLVRRYLAGESEKAIADSLGIGRNVVRRRLEERCVAIRGRGEAMSMRMARATPEERCALASAAHAAVRGRTASDAELVARAIQKSHSGAHISRIETLLGTMLAERGIAIGTQTAIGRYNADITSGAVAVEVFGGNWHFYGAHARRAPERFRYILDAGWHVLIVLVTDRTPLVAAGADYVTAFIKAADSDPSGIRQYRMIGGGGEILATCGADSDELPLEYPFRAARDSAGRYQRAGR